jgi:hypothetical protein
MNSSKIKIVTIILILFHGIAISQIKDNADILALPGFKFIINKGNKFQLTQENRFSYNLTEKLLSYEEFGLNARLLVGHWNNWYLTMAMNYSHILDENFNSVEYRPKIYFTTIYIGDHFRIGFRNRLDYFFVVDGGENIRYRPRIKIGYVYRKEELRLYPNVFDELIFDENGFYQHRIKLGLEGRYKKLQFGLGNLFIFNDEGKLTENRISLVIGYRLNFKTTKLSKLFNKKGVDPLYP